MSNQPQLFETEDQYGNDIIQGPKLVKQELDFKTKMIDPKNPSTVGQSAWNLGNHTLAIMFIIVITWVVWVSYA
jgi:hypothetical protein|tara:strand:- start:470 stop:691 length:222 start_codon:yes stop_codon:yes gene_type:complete